MFMVCAAFISTGGQRAAGCSLMLPARYPRGTEPGAQMCRVYRP